MLVGQRCGLHSGARPASLANTLESILLLGSADRFSVSFEQLYLHHMLLLVPSGYCWRQTKVLLLGTWWCKSNTQISRSQIRSCKGIRGASVCFCLTLNWIQKRVATGEGAAAGYVWELPTVVSFCYSKGLHQVWDGAAVLSYSESSSSRQHRLLCGTSLCAAVLALAKSSFCLFSLLNRVSGTEAWKLW